MIINFRKIEQALEQEINKYTLSLEENLLYPVKEELDKYTQQVRGAVAELKRSAQKKWKINYVVEGQQLVLNQQKKKKFLSLFTKHLTKLEHLSKDYSLLEEKVEKEITLEVCQGFRSNDGSIYPSSNNFMIIVPQKEQDYFLVGQRLKATTSAGWETSKEGYKNLEKLFEEALTKEGKPIMEVFYISGAKNYPLDTILPLVAQKYDTILSGG